MADGILPPQRFPQYAGSIGTSRGWIAVDYPEGRAYAQVWRAQVERVPLCLLDTDIPENTEPDLRNITDYLYGGDSRTRIRQAMLLGIGGYRALAELGISPTVCHINEGHSAFLVVERIRQLMEEQNLAFHEVREATFTGNIFTTHTPVPAGIDIFPPDLVDSHLSACTAHGQKLRFFFCDGPWHVPSSHLAKSAVSGHAQYIPCKSYHSTRI